MLSSQTETKEETPVLKVPNKVEIVCKLSLLSRVGKNHVPSRIGGTERGHCLSSKFFAIVKATTERLLFISEGNREI